MITGTGRSLNKHSMTRSCYMDTSHIECAFICHDSTADRYFGERQRPLRNCPCRRRACCRFQNREPHRFSTWGRRPRMIWISDWLQFYVGSPGIGPSLADPRARRLRACRTLMAQAGSSGANLFGQGSRPQSIDQIDTSSSIHVSAIASLPGLMHRRSIMASRISASLVRSRS